MDQLTSEVAIEEFLKQGVHNRIVRRPMWPVGDLLAIDGEGVARLSTDGALYELTGEDLDATDWIIDETEFL